MTTVFIRDLQTNKHKAIFNCENAAQAINIARHMNFLNEEAAKLTGKAIRFVYTIWNKK